MGPSQHQTIRQSGCSNTPFVVRVSHLRPCPSMHVAMSLVSKDMFMSLFMPCSLVVFLWQVVLSSFCKKDDYCILHVSLLCACIESMGVMVF